MKKLTQRELVKRCLTNNPEASNFDVNQFVGKHFGWSKDKMSKKTNISGGIIAQVRREVEKAEVNTAFAAPKRKYTFKKRPRALVHKPANEVNQTKVALAFLLEKPDASYNEVLRHVEKVSKRQMPRSLVTRVRDQLNIDTHSKKLSTIQTILKDNPNLSSRKVIKKAEKMMPGERFYFTLIQEAKARSSPRISRKHPLKTIAVPATMPTLCAEPPKSRSYELILTYPNEPSVHNIISELIKDANARFGEDRYEQVHLASNVVEIRL